MRAALRSVQGRAKGHARWVASLRDGVLPLWRAYQRWQVADGPLMAAAVAYYVGFAMFPLLLVLISIVGWMMDSTRVGQNAEVRVIRFVAEHTSPAVEEAIRRVLDQVQQGALLGGRLGVLGLFAAALGAFVQFERAFARMWGVPDSRRRGLWAAVRLALWERARAFAALLLLATLIFVVFAAGLVLRGMLQHSSALFGDLGWAIELLRTLLTVALNAMLFMLLYKWLPPRPVAWRAALWGGLAASIGWEIGRRVLDGAIIGQRYTSAYGVVGAFIALLLWCYYATCVVFLGAAFIQEISGAPQRSSGSASPAGRTLIQP